MKAVLCALIFALAAAFAAQPAGAVEPDEMLADPALEARARAISKGLRCLVCQNQSIDDSNAELARDLRVLVRERLLAGDSDEEVIRFAVERYGDFVLLKPPFKPVTYALWFGPFLILIAAATGLVLFFRRRREGATTAPESLSDEEERRVQALLNDEPEQKRAP